ncbi:MAG: hypothetical protein B6U77_02935 [Candidatus Hecatellales archaeon ex4484_218]|nr:MAG: hypothetical protein B6U77_02935 [Candidatus Hecatellales archaeon ex4484_218]
MTKKRKNEDLYSIPGVHEVRKPIWGSGTTSYVIDYRKKRKIKTFGKNFIIKKAPWEKTGSRYGIGIQIISIEKI